MALAAIGVAACAPTPTPTPASHWAVVEARGEISANFDPVDCATAARLAEPLVGDQPVGDALCFAGIPEHPYDELVADVLAAMRSADRGEVSLVASACADAEHVCSSMIVVGEAHANIAILAVAVVDGADPPWETVIFVRELPVA